MSFNKSKTDDVVTDKQVIDTLLNISSLMTTDDSLFDLLKKTHHYIAAVIDVPNIAIAQASLEEKTLTLSYFVDEKDGSEFQGKTVNMENGLSAYVLGQGEPRLLTDTDLMELQKQGKISRMLGSLCTSWIGVPIKHNNETLGIIIVQSYTKNVLYDERDLEILSFVAGNISTLLKQRQLAEKELASKNALEGSLRVITEKNSQIEQTLSKLKDAQEELIQKEKMASLGGLVAGVAHEINTPLGICVTGITNLDHQRKQFIAKVSTGKVSDRDFHLFMEDVEESCELILNNAERAANLISSFKQIAVDQSSEQAREINLNSYLHELIVSLNPLFKKTKHTIEIKCKQNIVVQTQPGAISQVFTNLITNSINHGFENIEAGQIWVNVSVQKKKLTFEYEDNGKGMTEEQLQNVFEPFYTTKRGQGGSGLGGNIIYNIVVLKLKGAIKVESELGKGTRFTIEFPNLRDN